MKTFGTFKELIDYAPNCIICGKQLELHINGNIPTESTVTDKWHGLDAIHFRLKMKDGYLIGKNKKYSFSINVVDNQIIDGQETLNKLLRNWVHVHKKCYTCRCHIITRHTGVDITNYMTTNFKKFPPLTLINEEVYFTRKREKSVRIYQHYYDDSSPLGVSTTMVVGRSPVKSFYVDFNKFKNLDQLNERISTILVFS